MSQKSMTGLTPGEQTVRKIRRPTRRPHSTEEKIRKALDCLRR